MTDRAVTTGTRTLLRFNRSVTGILTVATVLAVVSSILELAPFFLLYLAIEVVIEGSEPVRLVWYALAGGVLAALQSLTWSAAMYVSHIAAYEQLHTLRVGLLNRFTRLPLGKVTGRHSGDLQGVVVGDVSQLELFVSHSFPEFVSAIVSWVVVTVWLVVVDARLALATFAVAGVAFAILMVGTRRSQYYMAATSRAEARMSRRLVELLDGLLTTAVLDRSRRPPRTLKDAVDEVADTNSEWLERFTPYGTAYLVLTRAPALLILPVGGLLVVADLAPVTDLAFFLVIGLGYGLPILRLRRIYFQLNKISYAAGVIDETMTLATQPERSGPPPSHGSDLRFHSVSFGYGRSEVLSDVSFHAPAGSVTALVGPTGAGKSTLARLAARFWDVDSGRVTLGRVDIRDLPLDHLMRQVAFVFQDTFLFRDTVLENLRLADPAASQDQVEEAARQANVHDVVLALPDGYRSVIGSRGVNLSAGERQRLAIARAILHDSPLVILDEATAFVDPDSEAILRDALWTLARGKTVLIVAHRLSTVVDADQILVIDGGRLVQVGTHHDLVVVDGLYRRLWNDWTRHPVPS